MQVLKVLFDCECEFYHFKPLIEKCNDAEFFISVTKFSYSILIDNTRQFNATLCPCMLKELLSEVSGWQQIFSFILRQVSILDWKAVRQYEI